MRRRLIALLAFALAQAAHAQAQAPALLPQAPSPSPAQPQADGPSGAPMRALSGSKVYKSVDAQGRVTYSSMPQGNSRAVEPKPLPSGIEPYRSTAAASAQAPVLARPGDNAQPAADGSQDRWSAIARAQANLKAALAAQAQGVAPLPGERLATGNGGTRFAPAYDQRQAQLGAAVAQAQKDLDAAQKLP